MSNKKSKMNVFPIQDFAARLKLVRNKLNLETAEISNILGINKNSYYKYEDGTRFPKPEILATLITHLHVNVNYLFTGKGEMFLAPISPSEKEKKIVLLKEMFPYLQPETIPLIESLEIPIMKHSLMTEFFLFKEEFKIHIDEYFKEKEKKEKAEKIG